jgi:hypothetical protein
MTQPASDSIRSAVRTLVASLAIAGALWFLGQGVLSTPPIDSWSDFRQWLAARSTAEAALAALRASAVVGACCLAMANALSIVAATTSIELLERLAQAIVPKSLRPFVMVTLGAGVATAAAGIVVPRSSAPTQLATVSLDPPSDATATMYLVTEPEPVATAAPIVTTTLATSATAEIPPELLVDAIAAPAPAPHPEPAPAPASTWTIERGDHLWAIASETLAEAWQRQPTDSEVVPYWRDLIERNRARLVDPANPDYVLPGQVVHLPPVPPPARWRAHVTGTATS